MFHNKDKTLLIWVNEEDHLRIISMQSGPNIMEVYERLAKATTQILRNSADLEYMREEHLGYVTCCPTNLGTALRASVHLNLKQKKANDYSGRLADILESHEMTARVFKGREEQGTDGVILDVSNRRRLGKTENQIIQSLMACVKDVLQAPLDQEDSSDSS